MTKTQKRHALKIETKDTTFHQIKTHRQKYQVVKQYCYH